jgi:hypothetical protein
MLVLSKRGRKLRGLGIARKIKRLFVHAVSVTAAWSWFECKIQRKRAPGKI